MATLQYNIAVTGERYLKRSIRNVEQALKAHERRVNARGGVMGGGTPYRTAAATSRRTVDPMAKAFGDIAKVAAREERKRHTQRLRNIETEKRAAIRAEKQAAKAAERAAASAARRNHGRGTAVTRAVGGRAASLAAGALGVGSLIAGQAIMSRGRTEASATELANIHYGAEKSDRRSRTELRSSILAQAGAINRESGISEADSIEALKKFQEKSGNLTRGQGLLPFMAALKDAKGGELGEYGEFAGMMDTTFRDGGMKDPKQIQEGIRKVLKSAAAMAAMGQISMGDLASKGGAVTAISGRFGGDPVDAMKNTIAAMNLSVRGGATNADEAVIAAKGFSDQLIAQNKKLKAKGINVFDKDGNLDDMGSLIEKIVTNTGGDMSKLKGIITEKRAFKAIETQAKMFRTAEAKEKGSGRRTIREGMDSFLNANISDKDIAKSAALRRNDSDRQLAMTMGDLNRAVGSQLLPAVTRVIPAFAKLVPYLGKGAEHLAKLIESLAKNPVDGLGKVLMAFVVKEIATAALGKTLSAGITAILNGVRNTGTATTTTTTGTTTGGRRGVGALNAAAAGLTVGTIVAGSITAGGLKLFKDASDAADSGLKGARHAIESGDPTKIRKELKRQEKALAETESKASVGAGVIDAALFGPVGALIGALTKEGLGSKVVRDNAGGLGAEINTQKSSISELKEALTNGGTSLEKSLATAGDVLVKKISEAQPANRDGSNPISS